MDLGPIQIGPAEVIVAALLGLIASIVLVSLLIILLWGVALLVVAPTMSAVTTRIGRRRRHNWLRDQWLSVPDEPGASEPPQPNRPPVCGVSVVCDQDGDTHIDFLAAQVRPDSPEPAPEPTTMGVVHAVVRPSSQLNLLPHPDGQVAVLVLAGRGTAGRDRRPVRAGELAVFGPEASITVSAESGVDAEDGDGIAADDADSAASRSRPLEVLVLADAETEHAAPRGEVVVVERSTALQRRLAALKLLAEESIVSSGVADTTAPGPATTDTVSTELPESPPVHPVHDDAA